MTTSSCVRWKLGFGWAGLDRKSGGRVSALQKREGDMPSYGNVLPPVSVGFGDSAAVIASTEVIFPAPYKSAQVALAPAFSSGKVRAAVEIVWSGAPGLISVQLQTADTDIDAAYIQEGAAITNVPRAEFP